MLYRTHLAFGLMFGIFFWSYKGFNDVYASTYGLWVGGAFFFGLLALGSLLPDLDHPKSKLGHKVPAISHLFHFLFGHRGFLHSIFFVIIIGAIVLTIFGNLISFPIMIGMLSHLFSDCLTKQGINFIYPFKEFSIRGFIETGSIAEFILFIVSVVIILTAIFGRFLF